MIVEGFINLAYAFILAISSPFRFTSVVTLPGDWLSSISTASSFIVPLDSYIPVITIISVFFVFILFEVGYLGWKFVNWIIRKIPTIS
mgnify:CR=1 FL=1